MRVKCELSGQVCILPHYISQFFLSTSYIYCATVNRFNDPQIHPLLFSNESGKCMISFIQNLESDVTRNLRNHPYLALTIDKTDPEVKFLNNGIMVEAVASSSINPQDVQECFKNLQNKYGTNIITTILGIDLDSHYIRFQARPLKIVYWKGPFFRTFKCKKGD